MDNQETTSRKCSVLLQSGTRVRFVTPLFLVKATVVTHQPPSLVLSTDSQDRLVIPLADWYLEQPPDAPEHICVIEGQVDDLSVPEQSLDDSDQFLSVNEASAMAKVEEKQLRRYIRKGELVAEKHNGMWAINRDRFLSFAGDHGWL